MLRNSIGASPSARTKGDALPDAAPGWAEQRTMPRHLRRVGSSDPAVTRPKWLPNTGTSVRWDVSHTSGSSTS